MKRYYDNNKHNKSLYDNYSVKNFKQINVKYNIDKPFDIYSEIIEGNGKKTSGSISNMEDQIIRSYNTVKSKYKELKHHIDKLNILTKQALRGEKNPEQITEYEKNLLFSSNGLFWNRRYL